MPNTPSSYNLLKDVYDAVNRIEDKLGYDIKANAEKIDSLEAKTENLLGRIGVGVMIISTIVTAGISLIVSWVKERL